MELAKSACGQLEKLPECDFSELEAISDSYMKTVADLRSRILQNTSLLRPYHPYGQGNYELRANIQILEMQKQMAESSEK